MKTILEKALIQDYPVSISNLDYSKCLEAFGNEIIDAKICLKCNRKTIHQYAKVCMNCGENINEV